jgi:hypothetical protein
MSPMYQGAHEIIDLTAEEAVSAGRLPAQHLNYPRSNPNVEATLHHKGNLSIILWLMGRGLFFPCIWKWQ